MAAPIAALRPASVTLEPGRASWKLLRGAHAGGELREPAVLLAAVARNRPVTLSAETAQPCVLGVAIDGAPVQWLRLSPGVPGLASVPATRSAGLRADLRPWPGASCTLTRVRLATAGPRVAPAVALVLLAGVLALALGRRQPASLRLAIALGAMALAVAALVPAAMWQALPAAEAWERLAWPAALLLAGVAVAAASGTLHDRRLAAGVAIAAAVILGLWLRLVFLPAAGSWDTEYWKAWTLRAAGAGITQVYGDASVTTWATFAPQLRGEHPLWQVPAFGRLFTVDYPPLAHALWVASLRVMERTSGLDGPELLNAAVKLPPVLGDAAASLLLLWAFRRTPARARLLAAAYWVLPVSWLPSGVLGFLDGAYAPLLAASVLCAATAPAWAGVWLALACGIKPTAAVIAPALALAAATRPGGLRRFAAAIAAVVLAVALPYAIAGTLPSAVVHCARIVLQGNLSGGFANPWWAAGHLLHVAAGASEIVGPVRFAPLGLAALPVRPLSTVAFALMAAWIVRRQWKSGSAAATPAAAAALFFAYSMLALGVHENHPHPLPLLLLLLPAASRVSMPVTLVVSASYVLNMLALSGLGRLHGLRFATWEPLARAAGSVRMGLGVDLTLLLVLAHAGAFVTLLLMSWRGADQATANETGGRRP